MLVRVVRVCAVAIFVGIALVPLLRYVRPEGAVAFVPSLLGATLCGVIAGRALPTDLYIAVAASAGILVYIAALAANALSLQQLMLFSDGVEAFLFLGSIHGLFGALGGLLASSLRQAH
jgi:hypothetical protein